MFVLWYIRARLFADTTRSTVRLYTRTRVFGRKRLGILGCAAILQVVKMSRIHVRLHHATYGRPRIVSAFALDTTIAADHE